MQAHNRLFADEPNFTAKFSHDWPNHQKEAWVGVSFILIFCFSFGLGWSPVPWALPAEVHASSRRAKGVAITTCCNWLFNFIIGVITPPMIQHIKWGTFLFFAAFSFMSAIWTWFFCPETKGVSLEGLDRIFGTKAGVEEIDAKADILHAIIGISSTTGRNDLPALGTGYQNDEVSDKGAAYKGQSEFVERV